MVEYEDTNIRIEWNPELKAVEIVWVSYPTSEAFRSSMEKVLEIFNNRNADHLVTDTRKMRVLHPEDIKWSANDLTPRMKASGLKKTAIILSESVLSKMSMRRVVKETHTDNPPGYFPSMETARNWIKSFC
jgi:hypothetical protein